MLRLHQRGAGHGVVHGNGGPINLCYFTRKTMEFQGRDTSPLTADDLLNDASNLGCKVSDIEAVDAVEAPRGGLHDDARPTTAFESHAFHTKTGGRYDASHPGLSTPSWVRNYGAAGAH